MDEIDEVVREFLVESHENLDELDQCLVTLEEHPDDRETLAGIFRTIHTIKGTSGFLGFTHLESITHVGENLLSKLRDGELRLDEERTSALLAMIDAVRGILAQVEATGTEGEGDYSALVDRLRAALDDDSAASATAGASESETTATSGAAEPAESSEAPEESESSGSEQADSQAEEPAKPSADAPAAAANDAAPPRTPPEAPARAGAAEPPRSSISESSVRVHVSLLDKLMNLVGELVLARNQVLQFSASQEDQAFIATTQRLNLVTTELQEGVMKTRMQPIRNVWCKFPRVVRDLATGCGKRVRLEMIGEETELDRTIIEAIKDPLTHVVRNAIDHGIESPEDRVAARKRAEGCVSLRAFHEGGQVNIEISDDGSGIDLERVRRKAVERSVLTAEQARQMGDRELTGLIFHPGFSTAQTVSNISGRGVGMDVVKTHVEKIGGVVDLQTKPGEGTTLKIKIPLTLAIIPALVVTSAGQRFAIPQVSLLELVRLEGNLEGNTDGGRVEFIHGTPVYRLRGNLLPLVYLRRELAQPDAADADDDRTVNIVVLQADGRQFGLVVDEITDTEEVVVKPLGKQLKGITAFAGATIMGDGRVALILDVLGLAQRARVVSEVRERGLDRSDVTQGGTPVDADPLLVVEIGDGRFAIPLAEVARLEEFQASSVERSAGQEVIQYRGGLLPLMHLSRVLDVRADGSAKGAASLQVVVHDQGDGVVGLVVDTVVDIVHEPVQVLRGLEDELVEGSVVLQGRVTDLLAVKALLDRIPGSHPTPVGLGA